MPARLLNLIACALLVLTLAPRLALVGSVSWGAPVVSVHEDASPCHDGTDADHPCDNDCPCVCCAHARLAAPLFETPTPPPRNESGSLLIPSAPPDLHPIRAPSRLYRPPRTQS